MLSGPNVSAPPPIAGGLQSPQLLLLRPVLALLAAGCVGSTVVLHQGKHECFRLQCSLWLFCSRSGVTGRAAEVACTITWPVWPTVLSRCHWRRDCYIHTKKCYGKQELTELQGWQPFEGSVGHPAPQWCCLGCKNMLQWCFRGASVVLQR